MTLGYNTVGGGGISNQKMAFIGLFVKAFEQKRPLKIPNITMMDQINKRYENQSFDSIFYVHNFYKIAEKYDIEISQHDIENLPNGYDEYFWKTYSIFENKIFVKPSEDTHISHLVFDLLRAFSARVNFSSLSKTIIGEVFGRQQVRIAAQFRIELDWRDHCQGSLNNHISTPEDNYLEPHQIVKKILNVFPETRKIYAICDEPALPDSKQNIKETILKDFEVELIFKSDILSSFDTLLLRPLHLSLLDFNVASIAPIFVGISRSTFSSMVSLENYARLKHNIGNHFIYNTTKNFISLRTDNGCHADAIQATLSS